MNKKKNINLTDLFRLIEVVKKMYVSVLVNDYETINKEYIFVDAMLGEGGAALVTSSLEHLGFQRTVEYILEKFGRDISLTN